MIFRRLGLILNMEARRGAAPSKTSLPPRLRKERGIKGVRLIHKDQCGFTMIEMVIAIAIVGLIAGGITMTTFQVLEGSARSSNHTIAVRQVHNAGYWVSRDAQMAQSVSTGDDPPGTGFPLTLIWTDYGVGGDEHQVVYTLLADNKLKREHYTNRFEVPEPEPAIAIVAQFIDLSGTSCQLTGDVLVLTVTATVGTDSQEASETRTYEITPRPS